MKTKTNHLIQITFIYLGIALSGLLTWIFFPTENEILAFFFADITMTIVCFIFSLLKKNSSVYDAFWSLIPFFFILQLLYVYSGKLDLFHLLTAIVVSIWAWRLTLNWARSWSGFGHEDWRYIDLANKTGSFYPIVNFLGIHLFPTIVVFLGMLPILFMFNASLQHPFVFGIGVLVSFIGIAFEFIADNQLFAFRKRPNKKQEDLLNTGLWGRCRYPNYLGEMLFWIGLAVIGAAYSAPWYCYIGATLISLMIIFISIPMKEERMMERRLNYKAYQDSVPLLFPKLKT